MPIYEYSCGGCDHVFEVIQKMTDPKPENCPKCKHTEISRIISAAGFQLKGTGWYVTDFKNPPKAPEKPKTATPASTQSHTQEASTSAKASSNTTASSSEA